MMQVGIGWSSPLSTNRTLAAQSLKKDAIIMKCYCTKSILQQVCHYASYEQQSNHKNALTNSMQLHNNHPQECIIIESVDSINRDGPDTP